MCTPSFMWSCAPLRIGGGGIASRSGRNPMSRTRRAAIEDLRRVIDTLPRRTREAMLEGVREHDIIAGAYTDRHGGVCPMLAAHRHGGGTSFIAFARTWDRFTGARRARLATERELRVLTAQLEASLLAEDAGELGAAIAAHRRLVVDRALREEHDAEPAVRRVSRNPFRR